MSDTYAKLTQTAESFVAGYQAAFESKDASKVSLTLTHDCTRMLQPKAFAETLGFQHNPISVAEYEAVVASELTALVVGRIDMERLVVDTEKKAASLKVDIHIQLKNGAKHVMEFVYMLDFTESCEQVKAINQFADTAKINEVLSQIKAIVIGQN